MYRRRSLFVPVWRQVFPDLIRRKSQYRRQHERERLSNPVKRRLRRATRGIARRKRVETILDDVEVARRKRNRGKSCKACDRPYETRKPYTLRRTFPITASSSASAQRSISSMSIFRNAVARRIKTVEIAERKASSIAQFAITVSYALQYFR